MGLYRAWPDAEIVGIDIKKQPRYPFSFIPGDVSLLMEFFSKGFDFIWASPPCQAHSDLQKRSGKEYRCYIEEIRPVLQKSGKPFVIENVDRAPLIEPKMLCGTMFSLRVFRHRIFETNFPLVAPNHRPHDGSTGTHRWPYKPNGYVQVTGGGNCSVAEARAAMDIDWMTKTELNEAIPPAYSCYIAKQWSLAQEAAA